MEIAKQGDTIEWSFEDDFMMPALAGNTYQAKIAIVSKSVGIEYGVYTEYGMDIIPHEKCKIIRK